MFIRITPHRSRWHYTVQCWTIHQIRKPSTDYYQPIHARIILTQRTNGLLLGYCLILMDYMTTNIGFALADILAGRAVAACIGPEVESRGPVEDLPLADPDEFRATSRNPALVEEALADPQVLGRLRDRQQHGSCRWLSPRAVRFAGVVHRSPPSLDRDGGDSLSFEI